MDRKDGKEVKKVGLLLYRLPISSPACAEACARPRLETRIRQLSRPTTNCRPRGAKPMRKMRTPRPRLRQKSLGGRPGRATVRCRRRAPPCRRAAVPGSLPGRRLRNRRRRGWVPRRGLGGRRSHPGAMGQTARRARRQGGMLLKLARKDVDRASAPSARRARPKFR